MRRRIALGLGMVLAAAAILGMSGQPFAAMPAFETKKITDNGYVYRYQFHQAMFVVTPDGVIATDPIGYQRPQAVTTYIDEIRKITQAPIRYLVYRHHHYDHISGGKPFKDAGATIIAHRRAKAHLERLKNPDVPIPDLVVDDRAVLALGGTRLELIYTGRNHSDNSLVMLLPKEKLLFVVDFLAIEQVMFRNGPDGFIPDWFDSIDRVLELDWDRMIPGHPGPGGRLGTKEDVRAYKQYMMDVSDAVKAAAAQGKCWDAAMKEIKLPKYEKWANYDAYLPGNIERFCNYWGRGY